MFGPFLAIPPAHASREIFIPAGWGPLGFAHGTTVAKRLVLAKIDQDYATLAMGRSTVRRLVRENSRGAW